MLSGPVTEVAVVIKHELRLGGAKEDRTPDLLRARQALSQLSYGPMIRYSSLPASLQ